MLTGILELPISMWLFCPSTGGFASETALPLSAHLLPSKPIRVTFGRMNSCLFFNDL